MNFKKYKAKILGQRLGQSKNGNLQVILDFTPIGEYDPDGTLYELEPTDPFSGKNRRLYLTVTANTAERRIDELKKLARVQGKTPQGFEDFDEVLGGDKFISLAEVEADVSFRTEDYEGRPQEKWDLDMRGAPGAAVIERPEPKFVQQANAQFSHLFKASANGSTTEEPF